VGGDGELQNSGKRSLSIDRSSRSSLGLSNRGARWLRMGERQSASLYSKTSWN